MLAFLLAALLLSGPAPANFWRQVPVRTTASLRGLCVVSDSVAWASGTNGTYLISTDGGRHWRAGQVPGAASLDFRDVKAFSARLAYLAAVGPHGGIYKTRDGGAHWVRQYANPAPAFFLDGLAFWNAQRGLALGDPLQGKFLLLRTRDGGRHWERSLALPPALPGEGAFAASGSSLVVGPAGIAWFATGGVSGNRIFQTRDYGAHWSAQSVPQLGPRAAAGAGIFSLALSGRFGVAVGGDYSLPADRAQIVLLTRDGGQSWTAARGIQPGGYRSAVAIRPGSGGRDLLAVGTNGADISHDGGESWQPASPLGANSVAFTPNGAAIAVGPRGAVYFSVAMSASGLSSLSRKNTIHNSPLSSTATRSGGAAKWTPRSARAW